MIRRVQRHRKDLHRVYIPTHSCLLNAPAINCVNIFFHYTRRVYTEHVGILPGVQREQVYTVGHVFVIRITRLISHAVVERKIIIRR